MKGSCVVSMEFELGHAACGLHISHLPISVLHEVKHPVSLRRYLLCILISHSMTGVTLIKVVVVRLHRG
jgi:hypothetical protein